MYKMNLFSKLLHKISHISGQNSGKIVSWHDQGTVYIGFLCDGCGKIDQNTIETIKFNKEDDKNE